MRLASSGADSQGVLDALLEGLSSTPLKATNSLETSSAQSFTKEGFNPKDSKFVFLLIGCILVGLLMHKVYSKLKTQPRTEGSIQRKNRPEPLKITIVEKKPTKEFKAIYPKGTSSGSSEEFKYHHLVQNGRRNQKFEIASTLGKGGFGTVYKAKRYLDGQFYAVKVVLVKIGLEQNLFQHEALREVLSMKSLNSSHLLRYYDCWLEVASRDSMPTSDSESEDSEEEPEPFYLLELNIQMEFRSGLTLRDWLETRAAQIKADESWMIFRQILKGVLEIHRNNLIHRDLKPSNIFVDENMTVKIGDFGLAIMNNVQDIEPHSPFNGPNSSNVGSPLYLAPEQEASSKITEKADIYPLGLILLELLCDIQTSHERYQLFTNLRKFRQLPSNFQENFPFESQLIISMTQKNPQERPGVSQVLSKRLPE